MKGKASRHDLLGDTAHKADARVEAVCPCCGDRLAVGAEGRPECPTCAYPANTAAWVDYDGCC